MNSPLTLTTGRQVCCAGVLLRGQETVGFQHVRLIGAAGFTGKTLQSCYAVGNNMFLNDKMLKLGNLLTIKRLLCVLMLLSQRFVWPVAVSVSVDICCVVVCMCSSVITQVVVNGSEYQPQTASPNKKHAKAMAATVALQAMGEVSGDSVPTGPVFTAASTT